MLGFRRRVKAWTYNYAPYQVKRKRSHPRWIKEYYAAAKGFNLYTTGRPASERRAVVLSNSFGTFVAGHLAPGFSELYHVNLNHLTPAEAGPFLAAVLDRTKATDLIYLVHDAGLPSEALKRMATGVESNGPF